MLLAGKITGGAANSGLLNSIDNQNDFAGSADSGQRNSLQGNISATISEVLPNGTYVVRGERWLTLNQGDEFIRITGIVRAEDIGTDNLVDSTRVADARISYGGRGALADSNKAGWFTRFFFNPRFPL